MAARIEDIRRLVPSIMGQLSEVQLQAVFPENPLRSPLSTQQFLNQGYR
jgi:hypothetical protein